MTETILDSLIWEAHILWESHALFYLGVAAFCGALIGFEREKAAKPAGLRTLMLVSVGACLFTLASIFSWKFIAGQSAGTDPGRIAAQIVSGIGFMGAAVVMVRNADVTGITTAASIWVTAAAGTVIGLGFPLLGIWTAVLSSFTLFVLGKAEIRLGLKEEEK